MIGHEAVRTAIGERFPKVLLFLGPRSVGKWTLAEEISSGLEQEDIFRIESLTHDAARAAVKFSFTAPKRDEKVIIARLDGSTDAAQNILLKALEQAPPTTHFILVGSDMPLPTVASRAEIHRFSLLSNEQVEDILLSYKGRKFSAGKAKRAAELSGGQVQLALNTEKISDLKDLVLQIVRALRERDAAILEEKSQKWTDEHTDLLAVLCREVITKRWRIFQHAEVEGFDKMLALNVLRALRTDIRPRLTTRALLMNVLKGA